MAGNGLNESCGLVWGDRSGEGRDVVGAMLDWADRFDSMRNDAE